MVKKQSGQVIIVLILIMTVALAIGLSIVQKSLVDVSTSTKVEESSRAFSAAEAGIEHALRGGNLSSLPSLGGNNAQIKEITGSKLIPCIPGSEGCTRADGSTVSATDEQAPLEYPPLPKEEAAHVWLADFNSSANPPANFFTNSELDIYWGDHESSSDKAALELSLVYYDGSSYKVQKWYLDQIVRDPPNNLDRKSANCPSEGIKPNWGTKTYQCKLPLTGLSANLMLIRARLLYNTTSQPFAVQEHTGCNRATHPNNGCFIPPQAKIFTSTGISGETQRKVQVFQEPKVVPPYFDYAIFSTGEIRK